MAQITLTSKGQITLPVEARRLLGLKTADKIDVIIDPGNQSITLKKPLTVRELSAITSKLARKDVPSVMNVDEYYQKHRSENIR